MPKSFSNEHPLDSKMSGWAPGKNLALLFPAGIVLYCIARFNYLLFHSLVEGFAITVAALIYVLATRSYQYSRNSVFLFLGIAYLHIAVLDFFHVLTYKGMGVFAGLGPDTATQLWIAGRLLEALSFLALLAVHTRQFNRRLVTAIYTIVTAGLLISIMIIPVFPVCFIEGQGLTTFKVLTEYVIVAILLGSACSLRSRPGYGENSILKTVIMAMVITAISELSFTLYTDVYGIANMVGHMLKVVSYCLVYAGVVVQGIEVPYNLIAAELKDRARKDMLTGLFNRQGMMELIEAEKHQPMAKKGSMGVLMIDLDDFKSTNDAYGHLFGDEVLKQFAGLLSSSIRKDDAAIRFGGDEFVVLARVGDCSELDHVKQRIQAVGDAWIANDERLSGLGISIGASLSPEQPFDFERSLKMADRNMYAVKQGKKPAAGFGQ